MFGWPLEAVQTSPVAAQGCQSVGVLSDVFLVDLRRGFAISFHGREHGHQVGLDAARFVLRESRIVAIFFKSSKTSRPVQLPVE